MLASWITALLIHRFNTARGRNAWLAAGVVSSLGILFVFKYFDFFNLALRQGLRLVDIFYGVPSLKLLLPVGISFFTFQSVGYIIDVYRGQREPVRHLGIFALYVSFFPQLVAGPIERSNRLLPQFEEHHRFSFTQMKEGLAMIVLGVFKKLVIADRVAVYVNEVYNHPNGYEGVAVVLATYFFAFQIYCDFSGYSDIAIGTARVMGYRLMENFNRPYFSQSLTDFWRRWHISLSTWFRDYLYFPLGGNRSGRLLQYRNLIIVFLTSALWHGANWTFLIWGGIHVTFLIIEIATHKLQQKLTDVFTIIHLGHLWSFIKTLLVFQLVSFAWLFFRAESIQDAFLLVEKGLFGRWSIFDMFIGTLNGYELGVSFLSIILIETVSYLTRKDGFAKGIRSWPVPVRFGVLYLFLFMILFYGQFELKEFIYFQF